ncbi:MAG: RNA methyltransferase [Negativicutes bacterium]|nr:RNA methyltransferase [Negativicutes bacterium]
MTVEVITSQQNRLVKQAIALKQKKHRDELGLFVVEGVRLCEDFAASGWQGEVCMYTAQAADNPRVKGLLARLAETSCRLAEVPAVIYDKMTDTEQPQGIMILAVKRRFTFADLVPTSAAPLIAVLDGVQDPGNAGALIRAADAAGASGVILTRGSADVFAGKTVRATMGSLFHLPVLAGLDRGELLHALEAVSAPLVATALEAATVYHSAPLTGPLAIAFGNEGAGMSSELLAAAKFRIYIPIYGEAESLNVATAAAVVLFEAARQRRANL